MDNFKKTLSDASTFVSRAVQDVHIQEEASVVFNRAKQFTEEKLGKAERTDLDPHLVLLEQKTDNCKGYTEKIKNNAAAVLVPNPAARAESLFFDNVPVDKIGLKNERLTNLEYLGNDMIEAGNEFGVSTPYGAALVRVGQTQQRLGQIEKDYISSGNEGMIAPLQRFLDGEMKNIMRERKILENKRLDLDACKNKVRKARSMATQPQAENELRLCQAEFDRQAEITRLLMEGLSQTQTNHLRHLKEFVQAQVNYYSEAHTTMQELHRELSGLTPPSTSPLPQDLKLQRGQVLLDYDANGPDELSLLAHEVLNVYELDPESEDFLVAERGTKVGKIPRAYVKIIS
ncbi:endophilin-B1 isoform X2 [Eurytemora carolleeae]|uniref:endophilin-B1 isoform X2 n=1 Tax=Eurytemora carolleeae TaxID=1294199 RepID=UPI000C756CCD|nr:endophilin-B1 isoform X2 [Eurytemora carolleeae]|eukprot:XP_023340164.1 endophilin-B1-like isoform X2 [Eurytemora affinis]